MEPALRHFHIRDMSRQSQNMENGRDQLSSHGKTCTNISNIYFVQIVELHYILQITPEAEYAEKLDTILENNSRNGRKKPETINTYIYNIHMYLYAKISESKRTILT